jgi:two-component system alkaline phosphatase synthesis response regulator PhoP
MTRESILIIEDDPTLSLTLVDNFEFDGYVVQAAPDGRKGLALAIETSPDLIVLDIMLPRLNGYEVCRRIRARGLSMPIVMLTAKGQESEIILGLNLGADDYITKPFSMAELLARTNALLRRKRTTAPKILGFGQCEFRIDSRRLFRNGHEVTLTGKELGLMTYFARRVGRALTRDQILDTVWGTGIFVTTRSVDRCVNTLRKKVESDPHRPRFIKTIREIGYRFQVADD